MQQLQGEAAGLQEQLQGLQSEMAEKETIIERQQDRQELTRELSSIRDQVDGLTQQLADSSAQVLRLDAELATADDTHTQAVQVPLTSTELRVMHATKGYECNRACQ